MFRVKVCLSEGNSAVYEMHWNSREVVGVDGGHTKYRTVTPESRVWFQTVARFRQQNHLSLTWLRLGKSVIDADFVLK